MARIATLLATLIALTCAALPVEARNKSPTMPRELLGIWQPSTSEGATRCAQFRAFDHVGRPDADERFWPLVGAVVITPRMAHSYSDYGEGDFHSVHRVTRLRAAEWRIEGPVGIDTMPAPDEPHESSRFVLKRGVLRWYMTASEGGEYQADDAGYTRCTDLPADMKYD